MYGEPTLSDGLVTLPEAADDSPAGLRCIGSPSSALPTDLASVLLALARESDAWAFEDEVCDDSQVLFQYPAIMVPQMQRQLLGEMVKHCDATTLYDPFLGSGTTMAEAMLLGLNVVAQDVNPLAVLVSRVKSGPFYIDAFRAAADTVLADAKGSHDLPADVDWPNITKWFTTTAIADLAALSRGIRCQRQRATRRFLWVCLAETVRLTSNSRTSTVKLHVRTASDIAARKVAPIDMFARIANRNLDRFSEYAAELNQLGLLHAGRYTGDVVIELADVLGGPLPAAVDRRPEILLTSPPYGDNPTTVPYGQQAYLPLRWIDLADIDSRANWRHLVSTHAIDSMSLGGSRKDALAGSADAQGRSATLRAAIARYQQPGVAKDRAKRVASFWRDLDAALDNILAALPPGALTAWTVGNRCVGGHAVPMNSILTELLCARNGELVTEIDRRIPESRKRQAARNNASLTMSNETVLVVRAPRSAGEQTVAA